MYSLFVEVLHKCARKDVWCISHWHVTQLTQVETVSSRKGNMSFTRNIDLYRPLFFAERTSSVAAGHCQNSSATVPRQIQVPHPSGEAIGVVPWQEIAACDWAG
jgi:hypothetical protein